MPLVDLGLHLFSCDAVFAENLRELRQTDANEAGIPHHVEDVGERNQWERVPEVRAKRPFHIFIGWKPVGGACEKCGQGHQAGATGHVFTSITCRRSLRACDDPHGTTWLAATLRNVQCWLA